MTAEQLLKELEKANLITADVSAKVKREVVVGGRSIDDVLHERRFATDEQIAQVKSAFLGVPYQKLDPDALGAPLLEMIPEETVRTYGVAPIAAQENMLVVGMVNPDDLKAQEALKFIARKRRLNLGVYLISYDDWQRVLRKYSPYKSDIEAAIRSLNLKPTDGSRDVVNLEDSSKVSSIEEAPVIKIVAKTFEEAVEQGASDVHIEPQQSFVRIRFRVDGGLREEMTLPVELAQPLVSRIKVMSNLKLDESRMPQDGRFRTRIGGREIDFRVATFPTPAGEKVAIRVLDPKTGLKTLDDLGLAGPNRDTVRAAIDKPFGMVLITGPTGSGKSTTLYALLQILNKDDVNIVSLEDPVEYYVSGINQSQVRPEIGYDFSSGLRQILRQDPDVIMVGEIRDNETADLAIHAALTGHIVLSTLHTNNAAGTVPRLIDMKVEPFLLPSSLNLVIAQRLVSQLCESCREATEATPHIQDYITKALAGMPKSLTGEFAAPYKTYHAPGCAKCNGRGITGRIAIFEVLPMTKDLEAVINENPTTQKIATIARSQGLFSLRQDGVLKALQGKVSIEEVLRETGEE